MPIFSPNAVRVCLVILQILAVAGVWVMRVGERTSMAHSLRGLFILSMLLLSIVTVVSLITVPGSGMSSGIVLAVITVLAVIDCRNAAKR